MRITCLVLDTLKCLNQGILEDLNKILGSMLVFITKTGKYRQANVDSLTLAAICFFFNMSIHSVLEEAANLILGSLTRRL